MNANGQFREDEVVVLRSNINGEWIENRHVKVGGKLRVLHQENDQVSISTEVIKLEPDCAVVKATVQTAKGTFTGIGVATLNMDPRIGDAIVSLSETRAVSRACRHAGYAMDTCGAEELAFAVAEIEREQSHSKKPAPVFPEGNGNGKKEATEPSGASAATRSKPQPSRSGNSPATGAQVRALFALSRKANYREADIGEMLAPFEVSRFEDLTRESASHLISSLQTQVAA
ncbi:MAG: hypothetical protein WBG50_25575 [Desulfomonilaceae bacterium]